MESPKTNTLKKSSHGLKNTCASDGNQSGSHLDGDLTLGQKIKLVRLLMKLPKQMKKALDSLDGFKTLITSILVIAATFFPPVQQWISENPQESATLTSALYIILRIFTKKSVANVTE